MEVRALTFADLVDFQDHVTERQSHCVTDFIAAVEGYEQWPPHWGIIMDGDDPIYIIGLYHLGDAHYDSFTIFSKHYKPKHLRFVIKFVKDYMSMLEYQSIKHVVEEDDIAMNKYIKLMGFTLDEVKDGKATYKQVKSWA